MPKASRSKPYEYEAEELIRTLQKKGIKLPQEVYEIQKLLMNGRRLCAVTKKSVYQTIGKIDAVLAAGHKPSVRDKAKAMHSSIAKLHEHNEMLSRVICILFTNVPNK